MTNEINTAPFRAVHPSEILKDEIASRALSQKELAARMGMKQSNLSRLLRGEDLTLSVALKLEDALGIPSDYWMRLQAQYDRDKKAIAVRDECEKTAINAERALSNVLNLPELYKRLNISSSLFIQNKLSILDELLGFNSVEICSGDFAGRIVHNYKKSDSEEVNLKNQMTWLTLAYIQPRKNAPEEAYVKGGAVKAAKEISFKANEGGLTEEEIKKVLRKNGIAYSVVPKLEKVPIDAASLKVGDYPAIVTAHRSDDINGLVFNVLHELGHIDKHLYDSPRTVFIADGDTYSCENRDEQEANDFARNMLTAPVPIQ